MNQNFSLLLWSFLLVILGISGCTEDAKPEPEKVIVDRSAQIEHYWTCTKAIRNGRPAASISGLYFDFSKKDTLISNMMGDMNAHSYSIKGDTIYQGGDFPLKYAIVAIDSVQLQLNMEMNATKFSFFLVKSSKPN